MSRSKAKGTRAESAVRDYLRQWWPNVERLATKGAKDEGDLYGVPFTVVEVKNCRTYTIPAWMAETETERVNADELYGVLVVKPNGVGESRVEDWWVIQRLGQWAPLHAEANGHA